MKMIYLMICCIAFGLQAWSQESDTAKTDKDPEANNPFFRKLQLRQSFQSSDLKQNPAALQFTLPQHGDHSWLIDAGAAVTLGKLSQGSFTSKLVAEFHRNTLVESPQYNYQAGYSFSIFKSKAGRSITPVWTGNVKYVRDKIDSSSAVAAVINFTLYRSGRNILNLGRPAYLDGGNYTYQFSPSLETQYQQVVTSDRNLTGSVVRPLLDLSAAIAINKTKEKGEKVVAPTKLVELAIDYVNRFAIINSTNNGEDYTKLFKAGINYYLLTQSTQAISLGVNYNLGSDPINGLKDQRFWQFALQVQF